MLLLSMVLLGLGCWWAVHTINKNRAMKENIDENVIRIFHAVERGWDEYKLKHGADNANPYKYLAEFSKGERINVEASGIRRTESEPQSSELRSELKPRINFPIRTTTSTNIDNEIIGQPQRNSNKNFFSKFRSPSTVR